MTGEQLFPDTLQAIAARNAAAQAAAAQNIANFNVTQAKKEATLRSEQGHYITTPTGGAPKIMRSNNIGATVPSVTASRNLTPNGHVQQAMKPSLQTPLGVNGPLSTNRII
jgi:hypothetical protein